MKWLIAHIILLLAICSAKGQLAVSEYAITGTTLTQKKVPLLSWYDAGALTCAIASGLGRGVTNALRKDQGSLQRYLGVGDYDWGGRLDWERNYEGNRYWNEDTNAPNKHKTEVLGNFGRDGWHTADETTKWGDRLGTACFVVGSAIQIHRVAKASYASPTDRKKAIRKRIILCAVKGATVWAISSITEKRAFDTITQ